MFELLSLIAVVLAIVGLSTARGVRNRLESELAALRLEIKRLEGMRPTEDAAEPAATNETRIDAEELAQAAADVPEAFRQDVPPAPIEEPVVEPVAEPVAATETPAEADKVAEPVAARVTSDVITQPAPAKPKQSLEQIIAAQWTVWVGGLALALAGIFAVKYSIDQGFFSPAVRLSAAALFGLALTGAGEFLRRRDMPQGGNAFQHALIPGVLTAAGTLTLFGAIFVAHGVYNYFGPTTAFILLAIVSFATLGLSMLYGQGLAGVGLLGSFVTPLLVVSNSPRPWALFGFLAFVWIATTLASKIQSWRVIPALANAGLSTWAFLYLVASRPETPFDVMPVLLPMLIMVAGLAFIWPGNWLLALNPEPQPEEPVMRLDSAGRPLPARAPRIKSAWGHVFLPRHMASTLVAAIGGMVIAMVFNAPDLPSTGYYYLGFAALIAALAFFGAFRTYAIYPAIFAALGAFGGIRVLTIATASPGFQPADNFTYTDPNLVIWLSLGLGLLLTLLALAVTHFRRLTHVEFTRTWIVLGAITPFALAAVSFFFFGNYEFDLKHGLHAVLIGALFLGGAYVFYGDREGEGRTDVNRDLMVAASFAAFLFALLVMTNGIATTIGAAVLGFVYLNAQRIKNWPSLPWAMVAAAIFVAGRIAWEPTIVGAASLSTTPVFNQLLAGYGIPAALLIASAWLTRNSEDGRLRSVLETLASLFTLLTIAILVRHAMNHGTLNSDAPTLAEQAIYTLLAVGASATLMGIDLRRPSIVFRTGSMAIGYLSMASVIIAHMLTLNPYFTGETTGAIPFFNLLFLAYLLPSLAYAGAAWMANSRRPQHYVIALALTGAALAFAYVTFSVRRFYHGADISDWKGFLQAELYTYSVVWLLLGVALLVAGYRFRSTALRIASAILVFIAVLKVFLIDMANLEGLYRALSFFGLGVALIGIGRFYQKALLGLAKQEKAEAAASEARA